MTNPLQVIFFNEIKSRLALHVSLAEEVAELLNISTDSAYRRIRAEKPISFEEIGILSKHFHVSVDRVLQTQSDTSILFDLKVHAGSDFFVYLNELLNQTLQIEKAGQKMIYFDAKDFAPFQHFQFPELLKFKYFFWMKTILSYPELSNQSYEDFALDSNYFEIGRNILEVYNRIPSTEIWSIETLNTTLNQLEYFRYSGVITKKESIENIAEQLRQLIHHLQLQAQYGEKFLLGKEPKGNPGNFILYFNETYLGNNTILIETNHGNRVFINYAVLNYMITDDESFCRLTHQLLKNTIKKSSLISSVSEKERNRFFNALQNRLQTALNNLLKD